MRNIHIEAAGKWRTILPALGVNPAFLSGKHGPCPICGGRDRFRFDDRDGTGTFICSKCGSGSGVDLVMRLSGASFLEAVKMIEPHVPGAPVVAPKAERKPEVDGREIWARGLPVRKGDVVSRYLAKRGLRLDEYPSQIRTVERAMYKFEDGHKEWMPAMASNFVSPDRVSTTVHFTFLTGEGDKADVPSVRKFFPGKIPSGGAVRLAASAEVMGVAEGIETALSAMQIHGMPVWATLTAGGMTKWQPPPSAKRIVIFGDHDESYTGQHAAYALAYRLHNEGLRVEVRLPDFVGDWNDVHKQGAESMGDGHAGLA